MLSGMSPSGRNVNVAVTEDGRLLWGTEFSAQPSNGTGKVSLQSVAVIPLIQIVYIDNIEQEKSVSFERARLLEFFCRSNVSIRYAFSSNKAGPKNEPYITLPAGVSQPINLPANTYWTGKIYFAADAIATIQIEAWVETS